MTAAVASLELLARQLDGELAVAGTERYAALVRALGVPVAPAALVLVASPGDVAAAVRVAQGAGMRVAMHGAGLAGSSVDHQVLLVVLQGLEACEVDATGRARVGAGVAWRRLVDAAAPHGLAPVCGSSLDTRVLDALTDADPGPMVRAFGPPAAAVRALEAVTGDGVVRRVRRGSEPELFAALLTRTAPVGVVTAVELELVPVVELYAGALWFDGSDAGVVLHAWREWSTALPRSTTSSVALLQLPPLPTVPAFLAGRMTVRVGFTHLGDAAAGGGLLAPVRSAAPLLLDDVAQLPLAQAVRPHDAAAAGPLHVRRLALQALPAQAVDALLSVAGPETSSPLLAVELHAVDGAHPPAARPREQVVVRALGTARSSSAGAVALAGDAVVRALTPWRVAPAPRQDPPATTGFGAVRPGRTRALADRFDPGRVLADLRAGVTEPLADGTG